MTLDVLICTYNNGIYNIPNLLLDYIPYVKYKISWQQSEDYTNKVPKSIYRKDVTLSITKGKGLSQNRNNTLKMADSDLCLIADDDAKYDKCLFDNLINYYKENPKTDILIGKIFNNIRGKDYKKYPLKNKRMNIFNVTKISSLEISFRSSILKDKNITFDERFGINGKLYNRGEEAIFISDCLKQGYKVLYEPIIVAIHPGDGSGANNIFNPQIAKYWGGLCYRIYKDFAFILLPILLFKHHKMYKNNLSIIEYINEFILGIKSIKHKLTN
ncbi:MAG: glycosyltransferase family A protein [Proteiniphilum sp.]|uniref:glycosyltransferase family A protein n=1 Tax=Proteiniphilum sp. TaxID=1926877 RepID=UPI002ABBD790|nr:glycosyltransferase family A protein [Proteiniphilum sp.]MDY9918635.1 glycosyltransferase family A protein [Proteiniphilum sp.]